MIATIITDLEKYEKAIESNFCPKCGACLVPQEGCKICLECGLDF